MPDNLNQPVPMPNDPNVPSPRTPVPNTPKQKLDWSQILPTLVYIAIAVAILVVIGWGLSQDHGILQELKDITVARGLITFLIAITTMGIAIMLAISTIFSKDGDDGEKRFDKGKQVLSVLIGLLGTIVGFYFGSSPDTKAATTGTQPRAVAISAASFSNAQPKKGEKTTLSFSVSGGKALYDYSITFDPPVIQEIKGKSQDSAIKQEIVVPDTLAADTDVKYHIIVTDSENRTAEYNKDGTQKLSLKVK